MVNQSRNAVGEFGDTIEELIGEEARPGIAGQLQAVANIGAHVAGRQPLKVRDRRHLPIQIGQLQTEAGLEDLLARQNGLQAVAAILCRNAQGDKIAQQRLGAIIGLVDQDHGERVAAAGPLAGADRRYHRRPVTRSRLNPQLFRPTEQDIVDAGARLSNDDGEAAGCFEIGLHLAEQGRLSGAAVAKDQHQTAPAHQRRREFLYGRPHLGAGEEKLRVGRDPEWILP
ncbi:MAG TPA: hypothetical protein VJ924_10590 [Alphaproteobacteria bacterium]|nr:hypothetical protein [Alphaproteobacteria bacterium]